MLRIGCIGRTNRLVSPTEGCIPNSSFVDSFRLCFNTTPALKFEFSSFLRRCCCRFDWMWKTTFSSFASDRDPDPNFVLVFFWGGILINDCALYRLKKIHFINAFLSVKEVCRGIFISTVDGIFYLQHLTTTTKNCASSKNNLSVERRTYWWSRCSLSYFLANSWKRKLLGRSWFFGWCSCSAFHHIIAQHQNPDRRIAS